MLRILIYILGLILIYAVIVISKFTSQDAFLGALAGAFVGFVGSWILTEISLDLEEKKKLQSKKDNTKFIYEMYKMELMQNVGHLDGFITNGWIPFYRLKSVTRDSLWGQLADYSKDLDLFRQINVIYQEFELINNKIDIMNVLRTELLVGADDVEKKGRLEADLRSQQGGAVQLAENVIRLAKECVAILDEKISQT